MFGQFLVEISQKISGVCLLILFVVMASACGESKQADSNQGVLTDAQTNALKKAKETEEALKKAAEERAKSMQ